VNGLPELLNFIITTIQRNPHCTDVQILNTETFALDKFALKIRVTLIDGRNLQIRFYHNQGHVDYAYQVLQGALPIQRWDNKEHFPNLATYPHHFHTPSGQVENSPLIGVPMVDLPLVLELLFS
jgi:hypothetical protein